MESPWYAEFFGRDYARFDDHPTTAREVRFLETVLPRKHGAETLVLDLACGMGRHAKALARKGFRLVGVDFSEVLLARARSKRSNVAWIRGDMRHIPLADETCDGVVSMFSSLGYFEGESENYRVLSEIARVLRPGGIVVVDTVNRDFLLRHAPPQSWFMKGGLTVLEERSFDLVTSRSEVDVVVLDGAESRTYHHSIRLYTATELAMLLASLGIDTIDVLGGFDGKPLTVDTSRMILVGERMKR